MINGQINEGLFTKPNQFVMEKPSTIEIRDIVIKVRRATSRSKGEMHNKRITVYETTERIYNYSTINRKSFPT